MKFQYTFCAAILLSMMACSSRDNSKKEEIRITDSGSESASEADSSFNFIHGNASFTQLGTVPHSVILTGLQEHRLVTVYKTKADGAPAGGNYSKRYSDSYDGSLYDEREQESGERITHFMPGLDLIRGYNMLNVAHYDLTNEKLSFLFDKPVLVKSLYFPSFVQDSLHKKPINRDYYLVSVCDEDTNKDTIINYKDLRKFYHFDASAGVRTQLVPNGYSVIRSQYDLANDVMYIFARQDTDKNGEGGKKEPLHIFWIRLNKPAEAKRLY